MSTREIGLDRRFSEADSQSDLNFYETKIYETPTDAVGSFGADGRFLSLEIASRARLRVAPNRTSERFDRDAGGTEFQRAYARE